MPSDSLQPNDPKSNGPTEQISPPQPTDADVVSALVGIEHASAQVPTAPALVTPPASRASWFDSNGVVILFLAGVMVASVLLAWGVKVAGKNIVAALATQSQHRISRRATSRIDARAQ